MRCGAKVAMLIVIYMTAIGALRQYWQQASIIEVRATQMVQEYVNRDR